MSNEMIATTDEDGTELCQLTAFDRNRYFYGKLLTDRDFKQEQSYFNGKRWLINRLLFGSGIACGLEVAGGGSPVQLTIKPGAAIDACGREVIIPKEVKLDLDKMDIKRPDAPAMSKTVRLCVAYTACPQEPVPSMKGSACDEVCDFNRTREGYSFKTIPVPAAP